MCAQASCGHNIVTGIAHRAHPTQRERGSSSEGEATADIQQPRRTHHQLGLSCRAAGWLSSLRAAAAALRAAAAAAAAAVDRAALAPCHRELPSGGARSRGGGGGGGSTRGWKPDPQPPFAAGHSRLGADNLHGNRQSAHAERRRDGAPPLPSVTAPPTITTAGLAAAMCHVDTPRGAPWFCDRADRTVNVRAPALPMLVVARMRPSTMASRWKEFPTSSGAVVPSRMNRSGVQMSARASWLRSSSQPTSPAPSTRSRQKSKTASRCPATACHPAAAQLLWLLSSHTYSMARRCAVNPSAGPISTLPPLALDGWHLRRADWTLSRRHRHRHSKTARPAQPRGRGPLRRARSSRAPWHDAPCSLPS
eukprot:COSAG01_NODE_2208_length_8166_cov_2.677823_2_plen_365_part_00